MQDREDPGRDAEARTVTRPQRRRRRRHRRKTTHNERLGEPPVGASAWSGSFSNVPASQSSMAASGCVNPVYLTLHPPGSLSASSAPDQLAGGFLEPPLPSEEVVDDYYTPPIPLVEHRPMRISWSTQQLNQLNPLGTLATIDFDVACRESMLHGRPLHDYEKFASVRIVLDPSSERSLIDIELATRLDLGLCPLPPNLPTSFFLDSFLTTHVSESLVLQLRLKCHSLDLSTRSYNLLATDLTALPFGIILGSEVIIQQCNDSAAFRALYDRLALNNPHFSYDMLVQRQRERAPPSQRQGRPEFTYYNAGAHLTLQAAPTASGLSAEESLTTQSTLPSNSLSTAASAPIPDWSYPSDDTQGKTNFAAAANNAAANVAAAWPYNQPAYAPDLFFPEPVPMGQQQVDHPQLGNYLENLESLFTHAEGGYPPPAS